MSHERDPAAPDAPDGTAGSASADGGVGQGLDEAHLYLVVRNAVEDALLSVIGTLLLVGIGFLILSVGAQAVVGAGSAQEVAVGVVAVAFGGYLAAATLEIIPPVRDWF